MPQLLHIQSIGDVELFGINGSNYGNFVIDRPAWEARYGISAAGLQRGVLASAVPATTPAQPSTPFGDGEWRVGIDIAPGTYLTAGTDSCYWQRSSGFSGTFNDILANDNPRGQAVVTILPSDVGFTSKRCGTWVLADTVKPAQPSTQIGDGEWRVGIDIAPGTYLTTGADSCYWQRSSGFSGTFNDILANDNPRGQAVVTILPSDVGFTSKRCGTWVLADTVKPAQPSTQIGDGEWRVGIDIAPGTYLTTGADSCYWQRSSGFSGTFNDILANDNPRGQAVVTILPSDVGFTSKRCGTWTKR